MQSVKLEETLTSPIKSSIIYIAYKGDVRRGGAFPFEFNDTTTIGELKQKIIDHQVEWRKSLLDTNINYNELPPIQISKLFYEYQSNNPTVKYCSRKNKVCDVVSLEEKLVSSLKSGSLIADMIIPKEWKDASKKRSKKNIGDENSSILEPQKQKKVKQSPNSSNQVQEMNMKESKLETLEKGQKCLDEKLLLLAIKFGDSLLRIEKQLYFLASKSESKQI